MKRLVRVGIALVVVCGVSGRAAAAGDAEAMALVDKGIASLGGAEKLAGAAGYEIEYDIKRTFQGNESTSYGFMVTRGIDHAKTEVEGEFNGEPFLFIVVLAGDQGWVLFRDEPRELDGDGLARQRRSTYLRVVPTLLTPLKGDDFKVALEGEEQVDGKQAAKLRVTGPDEKDFTLYLDKQTGLPVKTVAVVTGFQGDEFTQETMYGDYKDFDGVKAATSVNTPGEGFRASDQKVTSFKLLEEVGDERFGRP